MKSGIIRQILALILAMMMIAGMLPAAFASDEAGYDVQGDAAAAQSVPEAGSGETKEISDKTEETETGSKTVYRAFEVSLQKDGEDLDVEGEFRVTVDTGLDAGTLVPEGAERTGVTFTLYHIHGDQVDIIEDADVDENGILTFTTPNFSTFVLKYTVDFAFEAEDGTVYEFSIPGGGCISLYNLAEELGLAKDDPETEADEIQEFIDNIQDVTFSNPDLVFIGKADAYFTVGNIKEGVGLECEYSEELTEDDIEAINSQIIKSGDWAVISLQPFTSDETLTITMKDGKTYTVQVTDAQIKKEYISDKGETWEIIVTYDESAGIPDGSRLEVEEITEENGKYSGIRQSIKDNFDDGNEGIPSTPILFDISIWNGDQKIEPAEGSQVQVEVKLKSDTVKGMYTGEDSPLLINDHPVSDTKAEMVKEMKVLHLKEDEGIDVVDTTYTIKDDELVSSFTTDSFSNWLLYLDEGLKSINVTTGDSITLRPYSEWIWKSGDETIYSGGQWVFPDEDWNTWTGEEGGVTYTYYEHKTNHSRFRSYEKNDSQLEETYTVVTSESLSPGTFKLQTNLENTANITRETTIEVNVEQGAASGKPDVVYGTSLITVNLFDYDVPYENGQPDFAHSGSLDEQGNVARSPYDSTINVGHDLKFLGYGGGNGGNDTWINNYLNDRPTQGIVQENLVNGYPVLHNGSDLSYLFNTGSQNPSVYAFPDVSGLFMKDNAGYYYYNSNANYAEFDLDHNFTLYEHTYTQHTTGSDGVNAKPIGFFPFHEYDTVELQPDMNFNKNLNHHFGMSMTLDFNIPSGKKAVGPDGHREDIIFEFSGDDDLWVFVDNLLVMDIGGIHQPCTGTINFTTGEIHIHGVNPDKTMTFNVGSHTLKMFYIERGGCDSNLSIRFNLPLVIGKGQLRILKKSTQDSSNPNTSLAGAVFGIWDNPSCEGEPYTVASSDQTGLVFKDITVSGAGQKYYLREITPPEGCELDPYPPIFTLTAVGPDDYQNYTFTITQGGVPVSETDSEYQYPIIRNEEFKPIKIGVHKKWQNTDGTPMEEPDNITATFAVKRMQTYITDPLLTVVLQSDNSEIFDQITSYHGDTLTITYIHDQDENVSADPAVCYTENTQNVLTLQANETKAYYTIDKAHVGSNGQIVIIIPHTFTDLCVGPDFYGENPSIHSIQSAAHETSEPVIDEHYEEVITLPVANPQPSEDKWTGWAEGLILQEKKDGRVYHYEYYVVEKDIPEGYEAIYYDSDGNPIYDSTGNPSTDPSSLATNVTGTTQEVVNRKLLDITLKKVSIDQLNAENPPTLKGAAFTIEKYTDDTFGTKDASWGANGEMELPDNDGDGVFSIEGLTTGFYKIVETAIPAGYIKYSKDPIFEVRRNSEKLLEVVLLNPDDTTAAANNQTEAVRLNDMTLLFGNAPGVELPKTGGQGTELFTILGGMITAAAGAVLLRRRKRQTKNN